MNKKYYTTMQHVIVCFYKLRRSSEDRKKEFLIYSLRARRENGKNRQ